MSRYDAIVIGGGFFGCCVGIHLSRFLKSVSIIEEASDILTRASYNNQARIHQGYHYPRSLLTGIRSRVNFPRFCEEFSDCVVDDFEMYYAISRGFSAVTASQFRAFCDRIGAPLEPCPPDVAALFNRDMIEDVFLVQEWAFDAIKLRERVRREIGSQDIELQLDASVLSVAPNGMGDISLTLSRGGDDISLQARRVFNCTYSSLNRVLSRSGLPSIPLKHEGTELCLVHPPDILRGRGVTVMCGPYFSIVPFPPLQQHTLSHVRYTPHTSWYEPGTDPPSRFTTRRPPQSSFERMIRDAARYLPCISDCKHTGSLWEVKTVLPSSETDDSRPILFQESEGLRNFFCLMGGKIDNIFDILMEMDEMKARGGFDG